MQITLVILRNGNTEILEEKNCTKYKELQKHQSNAKKEDMLKKFHSNRIIFHFIINLQQRYTFINILVLISTTAIVLTS